MWRARSAKDFAVTIVVALVVDEVAWLNYGLSIGEWPIYILGFINMPAVVLLVLGFTRYRKGGEDTIASAGNDSQTA